MKRPIYDLTYPGWAILLAAMMLCIVGLLCIVAAEGQSNVPKNAGAKQLAFILISIVTFCVLLKFGYQRLGRLAYAIFFTSLILLALLVLARFAGSFPLIRPIRGTYRWISLPFFNLQPSEVMKVGFIIGLAWYLRHRENVQRLRGLIGPFVLTIIPMFLVLLQPDLGSSLLLMPVLMVMLFAAGAKLRHLGVVVLLAVLCLPAFWAKMKPYQRDRVAGLLLQYETIREKVIKHPESWTWLCSQGASSARNWEREHGFQLLGSLGALGNGGLLGRGWKQGTYVRYNFLPAKQNDFIFALIGEQWGFVGCVAVLGCYLIIIVSGLEISARTSDPFGRLLAVGVVAMIATQMFINMGMNLGLTPITGMNLPFVSSGGSSSVASFVLIALLINISQDRPFLLARKPFEHLEISDAAVR